MLAHRSRLTPKQNQFVRFLWAEKDKYDFAPTQMYADDALAKLGLVSLGDIEHINSSAAPSPAGAFRKMHKMFARNLRDVVARDPDRPDIADVAKSEVLDSERMASFAPAFGVSASTVAVRMPHATKRTSVKPYSSRQESVEDVATTIYGRSDTGAPWYERLFEGQLTTTEAVVVTAGAALAAYVVYRLAVPSAQ